MPAKDQVDSNLVAVTIPFSTVATVLATMAGLKMAGYILPLFMPLVLGVLLAVWLSPIVAWLEAKGLSRWRAVLLITVGMILVLGGITVAVLPKLVQEGSDFFTHLPQLKEQFLGLLPENSSLRGLAGHFLSHQTLALKNLDSGSILYAGHAALGGVGEFLLVLIFAIYLVADGPQIFAWVCAFFTLDTQAKLRATADQISEVIFAYVLGQLVTSVLSFLYVLAALTLLKVPAALLLAVLAGIFDILPVLGFFLAVGPAMLFALKVSLPTALIVFGLYVLYHAIENYVIVPAVYGNRLRISTFVVLISLLAAGLLAGVEGAIAALPIVASYPIIEKIWLRKYVGEKTVRRHADIEG